MQNEPEQFERIRALAEASLAGTLTPAQTAQLEHILLTDTLARQMYVEHLDVEAELTALVKPPAAIDEIGTVTMTLAQFAPEVQQAAARTRSRRLTLLTVCSLLLFVGGVYTVWSRVPVATLVSVAAVSTEDLAAGQHRVGARLRPGEYNFPAGLYHLQLDSGVQIAVVGPASLKLISQMRMACNEGQISVDVPPAAQGFRIVTPGADVVDYGTRFTVTVAGAEETRVDVETGNVAFKSNQSRNAATKWLTRQEAASIRADAHNPISRAYNALVYRAPQSVFEISGLSGSPEFQRWYAGSLQLRRDDDLLAYFAFPKSDQGKTYINSVAEGPLPHLSARLVNTAVSRGRWQEKPGISIGRGEERSYVEIDHRHFGSFDFTFPFSVAIWFRCDDFRDMHQPLVTQGNRSWRMQGSHLPAPGMLTFKVHDNVPVLGGIGYASTQIPVDDGAWHLAVGVYDPSVSPPSCAIYLDGEIHDRNICDPLVTSSEPILIGANSHSPERQFYGDVDEFALFRRALNSAEIKQLYSAGSRVNP